MMKFKRFGARIVGPVLLVLAFAQSAAAGLIVQYNPTGAQSSGTPVPSSFTAPGVTATALSQVGLDNFWGNTDVLPVGLISSSGTITLGEYLTFIVTGNIDYNTLSYSSRSYFGTAATLASVRSSLDSFAADIDTISVGSFDQELTFNLSSLPVASGSVEFRVYFYAATADRTDWNDLRSTAAGGNGLQVDGTVVPEPASLTMLGLGALSLIGYRLRRRKQAVEAAA